MQKAHKSVGAGQYLRSLHRRIVPFMEIRVHCRLFLPPYKGCTNERFILSRRYGYEEFKNVNLFSVQKVHKAVGASQYLRSMQRRMVPSMVILVHSRLILARYKGCTNGRCLLSRSYGHEEFKNVNPFPVQKAHKNCTGRPISPFPTAPYIAVNGNSRTLATLPTSVQRLH